MTTDRIELILTKDQALVFFELLADLDSSPAAPPDTSAEKRVLWELETQLERVLAEPFAENYPQLLDEARRNVLASTGNGARQNDEGRALVERKDSSKDPGPETTEDDGDVRSAGQTWYRAPGPLSP